MINRYQQQQTDTINVSSETVETALHTCICADCRLKSASTQNVIVDKSAVIRSKLYRNRQNKKHITCESSVQKPAQHSTLHMAHCFRFW